jgi:hypothetical protein
MALAAALAFTTIVTFALVLTGTRGGLFSNRDDSNGDVTAAAAEPSPEEIAGALQYLASAGVPPAQEPEYVTEYVYVDEPSGPPTVRYVTAPSAPGGRVPLVAQPTAPPAPAAPAPEPTEPAWEPTQPAPPPLPTEAPPPPPPPAPTSPPRQSGPLDEDEFSGTVTAINGNVVTFAHDGTTTDVKVTEDLDRLDVGTRAKVHALLLSSGWVAKEIEVDDEDGG